jgi:hypothetical protein
MMDSQFKSPIFGAPQAKFFSSFSLEESVSRLASAIEPSTFFSSLSYPCAVGKVSPSRTILHRKIPLMYNMFKPIFIGKFKEIDGQTVLVGTFKMHWTTKAFMSVWFSFCMFIFILTALSSVNPKKWGLLMLYAGMFIFGLVMVGFGKWLSRKDIDWLSRVISSALRKRKKKKRH